MIFEFATAYNNLSTQKNYLIKSDDNSHDLFLSLPGVPKESTKIKVNADAITISVDGEHPMLNRKEWRFAHKLGEVAIHATMKDGLLKIKLTPKASVEADVKIE